MPNQVSGNLTLALERFLADEPLVAPTFNEDYDLQYDKYLRSFDRRTDTAKALAFALVSYCSVVSGQDTGVTRDSLVPVSDAGLPDSDFSLAQPSVGLTASDAVEPFDTDPEDVSVPRVHVSERKRRAIRRAIQFQQARAGMGVPRKLPLGLCYLTLFRPKSQEAVANTLLFWPKVNDLFTMPADFAVPLWAWKGLQIVRVGDDRVHVTWKRSENSEQLLPVLRRYALTMSHAMGTLGDAIAGYNITYDFDRKLRVEVRAGDTFGGAAEPAADDSGAFSAVDVSVASSADTSVKSCSVVASLAERTAALDGHAFDVFEFSEVMAGPCASVKPVEETVGWTVALDGVGVLEPLLRVSSGRQFGSLVCDYNKFVASFARECCYTSHHSYGGRAVLASYCGMDSYGCADLPEFVSWAKHRVKSYCVV